MIRKIRLKKNDTSSVLEIERELTEILPNITALSLKQLEEEANQFIKEEVLRLPISEHHKSEYLGAFTVVSDYNTDTVHINFSTSEWVVFAMEIGVASFSIKDNILKKATKVSKKGYRYRTIPMTNRVPTALTETQKESRFWGKNIEQELIMETIRKLNYKYTLIEEKEEISPSGDRNYSRRETFYLKPSQVGRKPRPVTERVRVFATKEAFKRKAKPILTTFTNFKTVSENPDSLDDWTHPGFPGYNLVDKVQQWCETRLSTVFSDTIDRLMREL